MVRLTCHEICVLCDGLNNALRAYIMAGLNRVLSGQVNLGATYPLRTLFQHETRRNFSKMAIYETGVLRALFRPSH